MSKSLAVATSSTVLLGTAATGAYALGAFDGLLSTSDEGKQNDKWLIDTDFDRFKSGKGGKCVEGLFTSINPFSFYESNAAALTSSSINDPTGNEVDGCVVATMAKAVKEKDQKWAGSLAFLWALKRGNSGFVAYVTISLDESSKKSKSALFLLSEQSGTWSVSHKDIKSDGIDVDVQKNLPKLNSTLLENGSSLNVGNDDLSKLGKKEEMTAETKTSGIYWTWSSAVSDDGQSISGWSSNFDAWISPLFSAEAKSVIEKFTKDIKGSWQKHLSQ